MKVIRHAGVDSRMIILDNQARQQEVEDVGHGLYTCGRGKGEVGGADE